MTRQDTRRQPPSGLGAAEVDLGSQAPEALTSHVLALVQLVAIRTAAAASKTLRRDFAISAMDFRILTVLAGEPGASGARLAAAIGCDQAAVSRSATGLVRRGLVEESRPLRGRARPLTLTPEGRELQGRAWDKARERERRLVSILEPEEEVGLKAALLHLLQAMPSRNTDD